MAGAVTDPALSYAGSGAVTANRFVKLTGDQTVVQNDVDGGKCLGVANSDIKTSNVNGTNEVTVGKVIGVWAPDDVVWVECGEALTRGVEVESDNVGRANAAETASWVLGTCLKGTANAGELALVQLGTPYVKP